MNMKLQDITSPHIVGVVKRIADFPSRFVEPRHIDIWLPPSYATSDQQYPVLYMHDGQSLFMPGYTFTNHEWGVDEMMTRLIAEDKLREAIVVGIWNNGEKRFREYQPHKPFVRGDTAVQTLRAQLDHTYNGGPLSDDYLQFIVEELKPVVDGRFRTLTDQANTFMMGSSMGGVISIYALAEYPDVFGGVACLSTHFPLFLEDRPDAPPLLIRYLQAHLPRPGQHKIYFDYGTKTIDAWYEPHQLQIDAAMAAIGYTKGVDWVTHKFEGEEHSEIAWRKRLDVPLTFLLGKKQDTDERG
ncbi:MAG: alpha/beta hydrolase [Anaerolineales bacterium]|nr:alpha/beta hydrolase [Anaerolineales bacterium]